MPYRNIHWIKLEKRLLNDHRFFTMSEIAQLYYIKLLLLCAETNNRIPRKYPSIKALLRTEYTESKLNSIIEEIKSNFPKLLSHKDFYYIKGFQSKHNRVFPRMSQGSPEDAVDKIRVDKKRKEENKGLLTHFQDKYKDLLGVPYPIAYGKDQKLIYELMDIYQDPKDITFLIDKFFEMARDPKCWWSDKISVGVFKQVLPQVIGKVRK